MTAPVVTASGAFRLTATGKPPNDVDAPSSASAVVQWGGGALVGGARFVFDNNDGNGPVSLKLQMQNVTGGNWFDTHTFNADGTITDEV